MYRKLRFFQIDQKCGFVCTVRGGFVDSNRLCVRDRDEPPPYSAPQAQSRNSHSRKPLAVHPNSDPIILNCTQPTHSRIAEFFIRIGFVMQSAWRQSCENFSDRFACVGCVLSHRLCEAGKARSHTDGEAQAKVAAKIRN